MDFENPDLPAEVSGDAQLDDVDADWMPTPMTAESIATEDAVIEAHLREQDELEAKEGPDPHGMYVGSDQPDDGKARCRCGLVFDTVTLWMEHAEKIEEAQQEVEWLAEHEQRQSEDVEPEFKG